MLKLRHVLKNYLREYKQIDDEVSEDIRNDKILCAYFKLTQNRQNVANESRNWFFVKIRHLVSLKLNREEKWQNYFKQPDLIHWWDKDEHLIYNQLTTRLSYETALHKDEKGIDVKTYQTSSRPTLKGTYLHEKYYTSICHSCISAFDWESKMLPTVIKGGRMMSPIFPYVACTPDAIVVKNEDMFWTHLENGVATIDNICMTMELKTKHLKGVSQEEQRSALNDSKDALQIFTQKLCETKTLFEGNDIEDYDHLERYITRIRHKSKKNIIDFGFLTKQYEMMRRDHFEAICMSPSNIKRVVTTDVLPNLALSHVNIHQHEHDKHRGEEDYEIPIEFKTTFLPPDHCPLADLVSPGMGCLMVFDDENNEIIEYRMKKAPFILTLNGSFFNQVLEQHLVSRPYSSKVKAIFAIGICSDDLSMARNKMSMVYWYDTGITSQSVHRLSRNIDREMYNTSKVIPSMQDQFKDRSKYVTKTEQKKIYLPEPQKPARKEAVTVFDIFGDDLDDIESDSGDESSCYYRNSPQLSPATKRCATNITVHEILGDPLQHINWKNVSRPLKSIHPKKRKQKVTKATQADSQKAKRKPEEFDGDKKHI